MKNLPTLTEEQAVVRLKLFVEKAEELENHSFTKKILEESSGVTINFTFDTQGGSGFVKRSGPEGDSLKAFTIIFRLFVEESWGRKGELKFNFLWLPTIYDSLPRTVKIAEIIDKTKEVIDLHNSYMLARISEKNAIVYNNFGTEEPTRRALIDTFFYADDFHVDESKRKTFLCWKNEPILFYLLENEFVKALAWIMDEHIFWLADLHKLALKEIQS